MKIETHLKNFKESSSVIDDSIEKGLAERQRTIGFSVSSACVDLLEILLHKKHLIDAGFVVKHEWLKSKNKIREKLPFDFPKKQEILDLLFQIEEKRNLFCYGNPQKEEIIRDFLDNYNKAKKLFKEAGIDEL